MHTYRQCLVLFQVLQLVLIRNNVAKTGIKYYLERKHNLPQRIFRYFFLQIEWFLYYDERFILKIVCYFSHFEIILDAAKPVFITQFSIFCPLKYSFIRDHTCEAPRKNLTMLQCYYKCIQSLIGKKLHLHFTWTIYEI